MMNPGALAHAFAALAAAVPACFAANANNRNNASLPRASG